MVCAAVAAVDEMQFARLAKTVQMNVRQFRVRPVSTGDARAELRDIMT